MVPSKFTRDPHHNGQNFGISLGCQLEENLKSKISPFIYPKLRANVRTRLGYMLEKTVKSKISPNIYPKLEARWGDRVKGGVGS